MNQVNVVRIMLQGHEVQLVDIGHLGREVFSIERAREKQHTHQAKSSTRAFLSVSS